MNTQSSLNIPKTSYVFISYSSSDSGFVQQLANDLKAYGISTWIDKPSIKPGTPDWDSAIRYAIGNAKAVILIASPSSRQSRYVRDELSLATDVYHCPVYPVWASGTQFVDSVPLGWGATQYVDVRGTNYPRGLRELIQALHAAPPVAVRVPPPRTGLENTYASPVPHLTPPYSEAYQGQTNQPAYVTKKGNGTKIVPTCLVVTSIVVIIAVVFFVIFARLLGGFLQGIRSSPGLPGQTQSGHLLVTPSSLHLVHVEGTHQGCFYFAGDGWTCSMTLRNDANTGSFYWTTTISPSTITLSESKAIVPLDSGASDETSIKIPDDFCTSSGNGKVTFKGPENSVDVAIDCTS